MSTPETKSEVINEDDRRYRTQLFSTSELHILFILFL